MSNSNIEYYLKGGVQTSIDTNDVITKNTTWIVMDKSKSHSSSCGTMFGWMLFEESVQEWAGHIGDAWKKPTPSADSPEITAYTEDNTFVVQNITMAVAPGRTHYEVTFTNVQNNAVVKSLGADIAEDANGQRTKTCTYRLNIPSGTSGSAGYVQTLDDVVDTLFKVGEEVVWDDARYGTAQNYLITSVNCNHQNKSSHTATITAKEMSKMMVGVPTYGEDNFKQKTATVTWRLSKTVYETLLESGQMPVIGEPIGDWLLDDGNHPTPESNNYIVTGVNANPDGKYGYSVQINAKHVSKRLVKQSYETKWVANGRNERTKTTIWQSDPEHLIDFEDKVGMDKYTPGMTTTRIAVAPQGVNDYEVTIEETNNALPNYGSDGNEDELAKQVTIQTSLGQFQLTPHMLGFDTRIGGVGEYQINFPPRLKRFERLPKAALGDNNTIYGATAQWEPQDIVTAIETGKIGFSFIYSITYTDENNDEQTLSRKAWIAKGYNTTEKVENIDTINVYSYVYALPGLPTFTAWNPVTDCPLRTETIVIAESIDENKYACGIDIKCRTLSVYDIQVTMNYKGDVPTILRKEPVFYFDKAVRKIDNPTLFSYKFDGINYSTLTDSKGRAWTAVTINMRVLTTAWKYKEIENDEDAEETGKKHYVINGWNQDYVDDAGNKTWVITK